MVAAQRDDPWILGLAPHQECEHARAVRAAIDIIAQVNEGRVLCTLPRPVQRHLRMRPFELGQLAVDIADGVEGHGPTLGHRPPGRKAKAVAEGSREPASRARLPCGGRIRRLCHVHPVICARVFREVSCQSL